MCYFFRFGAKSQEALCKLSLLLFFVCLAPMLFKVNTANIQYFLIFLDIQITQDPLCTAVLTTIVFSWLLLETSTIFCFFWQLNNVNLILWLMTYTTLHHDLHKNLLCECKMSSKIGSLRCMKYIEKKLAHCQPVKPFWGDNEWS